jgi:hypothetical protein
MVASVGDHVGAPQRLEFVGAPSVLEPLGVSWTVTYD